MNEEETTTDTPEDQPTEVSTEEVEAQSDDQVEVSDGNDAAEVPADTPPEAEQVTEAVEDVQQDQTDQEDQVETD